MRQRMNMLILAGAAGLAISASAASAQLTNGGFETGDLTGWTTTSSTPAPSVSNTVAHSGTYSAFLGNPIGSEPLGDCAILQTFTVPANGILNFWYYPFSQDSITFDWQNCDITDSTGATVLANVMHVCQNTSTWTFVSYDLSAYVGQTIGIQFLVHQDGFGDVTNMYVDDVFAGVAPTGACCMPDGSCSTSTQSACVTAGGNYHGDNVTCAAANCPQPGACCHPDGTCTQSTGAACSGLGGIYHGDNTLCSAFNCNVTGACCTSSGCQVMTQLACNNAGGIYTCDNSTCGAST